MRGAKIRRSAAQVIHATWILFPLFCLLSFSAPFRFRPRGADERD
jgi:hypothetical protein